MKFYLWIEVLTYEEKVIYVARVLNSYTVDSDDQELLVLGNVQTEWKTVTPQSLSGMRETREDKCVLQVRFSIQSHIKPGKIIDGKEKS